jgi:hypothetical protein
MSALLTFDTLEYAELLRKNGFSDQQAKVLAELQKKTFAEALETQLATKSDIQSIKNDIMNTKLEMIKWTLALLLAQTGFIIAAFKLLV